MSGRYNTVKYRNGERYTQSYSPDKKELHVLHWEIEDKRAEDIVIEDWTPPLISNLTAFIYSDGRVDLSWDSSGALTYDGHKIYKSIDGGNTYSLVGTNSIATSYQVTELTVGQLTHLKVAAYKGNRLSEFSNVVFVITGFWYLPANITNDDVIGAYTPKGKDSLADTYVNLAHPGTNNLTAVTAPTLFFDKAWNFNGVNMYLKTGIAAGANYSYMIAFSSCVNELTADYSLFGSYSTAGGTKAVLIQRSLYGTPRKFNWANGVHNLFEAPDESDGIVGMTATNAFRNGIKTLMGNNTNGIPTIEMYLGALNFAGTVLQYLKGRVSSFAVYNKELSDDQMTELTSKMPLATSSRMTKFLTQGFGAFLCWSLSTYYGNDAGYVNGDINIFNPTDLDIDEWLDTYVTAGMKYATICAKTEDGFCLWPTSFADTGHVPYGIGSTTWYSTHGNYDIVKNYINGCRLRNLEPVLYYSIRDLTHEERSGTDETTDAASYIAMIELQLTELLTNYGNISVIWLDDWNWHISFANIPFAPIYRLIKELQPDCLILNNSKEHPGQHTDIEVYEPASADGHVPAGNLRISEEVETIRLDNKWSYNEALDQTAAALMTKEQINAAVAQANARNSNYLIGISPDKTGHLTPAQKSILESLAT